MRYGIDIPPSTQVGPGLYINHPGGIVVNSGSVIGANCNLSHEVTLGQANRGARAGLPVVGDGVYIGPGAKIVGAVRVGDDVAIGANAVVTSDVPDHAVVGRRARTADLARRRRGLREPDRLVTREPAAIRVVGATDGDPGRSRRGRARARACGPRWSAVTRSLASCRSSRAGWTSSSARRASPATGPPGGSAIAGPPRRCSRRSCAAR